MDEADFMRLLSKYPVVRSNLSVLKRGPRKRTAQSAIDDRKAKLTAAKLDDVVHAIAVPPPKDFWTALEAFLNKHYDAKSAKAIAAKFDELHYESLRSLNYEDIDDIAAMFLHEVGTSA